MYLRSFAGVNNVELIIIIYRGVHDNNNEPIQMYFILYCWSINVIPI